MTEDLGDLIRVGRSNSPPAVDERSEIVSESDSGQSIKVLNECCKSDPYFSGSIFPFSAICDNYKEFILKRKGVFEKKRALRIVPYNL